MYLCYLLLCPVLVLVLSVEGQAFILIGLLFGLWVVNSRPIFVSLCDPQEVVLFISDLSQQFLMHQHASACARLWALETPMSRSTACWNSPPEFIDLYRVRCVTSRLVLHLSCWQSRELSSHFYLCSLWKRVLNAHHLTTKVSLYFNGEKDMVTMALFLKTSWRILCMYNAVFLSFKQNLIQLHCSLNHALENCGLHCTTTTLNTHWKTTQLVMATELTTLTQKVPLLWHLMAESCTSCHC
jgi:hypothetical protein